MYPYTSQTLNEDGNEDGGPVQLSKIEVNSTVDLSQFDIPTKK
jgi:hypothetical protein